MGTARRIFSFVRVSRLGSGEGDSSGRRCAGGVHAQWMGRGPRLGRTVSGCTARRGCRAAGSSEEARRGVVFDAAVERFSPMGRRATRTSGYYGWNPCPRLSKRSRRRIPSRRSRPAGRAGRLQPGRGRHGGARGCRARRAGDYDGKSIKGKIVRGRLLAGPPAGLRTRCSRLPSTSNQTTAWSGDDRDPAVGPSLSVPDRQPLRLHAVKAPAEQLWARLAAGEKITPRARVAAKMVPASYDVVVATIPGSDPPSAKSS